MKRFGELSAQRGVLAGHVRSMTVHFGVALSDRSHDQIDSVEREQTMPDKIDKINKKDGKDSHAGGERG